MSKRKYQKEDIIDGTCKEIRDDIPQIEAEGKIEKKDCVGKSIKGKVLKGLGYAATLAVAAYVVKTFIIDKIMNGDLDLEDLSDNLEDITDDLQDTVEDVTDN